jgi:hypothetical protein
MMTTLVNLYFSINIILNKNRKNHRNLLIKMQTNCVSTIMIYKQKNIIIHSYFKMDLEIKQIIIIQIQVYINQINNTQEDKKLKINILNRFTKIESYPIIIINLN